MATVSSAYLGSGRISHSHSLTGMTKGTAFAISVQVGDLKPDSKALSIAMGRVFAKETV